MYDRPVIAASVVGVVAAVIVGGLAFSEIASEQAAANAQWAALCRNQAGDRLDDDQCGDWDENGNTINPVLPGNYFMWVNTSVYTGRLPRVGERVTIGQRTLPSGSVAAKGIPRTGGDMATVKRGGFGVSQGKSGGSASS